VSPEDSGEPPTRPLACSHFQDSSWHLSQLSLATVAFFPSCQHQWHSSKGSSSAYTRSTAVKFNSVCHF